MKLITACIVTMFAFCAFESEAQSDSLECEQLKFQAGESISREDYTTASSLLLKVEKQCGLTAEYWERLIESLQIVIELERDQILRKPYCDTILSALSRQEAAGLYNENLDLIRGVYIMQSTKSDTSSADFYFQRGIKSYGYETPEQYLVYAYYTLYLLYKNAVDEEKSALKERMRSDYFRYTEIALKTKMSRLTKETLTSYFEKIFPACADLNSIVPDFIDSLPQEKLAAISMIRVMVELIEKKPCTNSREYAMLIDTWSNLDSNSMLAFRENQRSITAKYPYDYYAGPPPPSMPSSSSEDKMELVYNKAYEQFKAGKYNEAHLTGLKCKGAYKSKGLLIAAQSVAATAMSCGNSTFERKCNYLYAAQLAEEAGNSELAGKYRAKAPIIDCSINPDSQTITLSCWGVTVNLCQ